MLEAKGMENTKKAKPLTKSFIAVKRHHDQGNSYKGKYLIDDGLQFQRFSTEFLVSLETQLYHVMFFWKLSYERMF